MRRLAIVSNGRAGSNLVADIVGQNPEVWMIGEVLNEMYRMRFRPVGMTPKTFLNLIMRSRLFWYFWITVRAIRRGALFKSLSAFRRSNWIVIKDNFMSYAQNGVSDYFQRNPDLSVLLLTRRNTFERWLSGKVAVSHRRWTLRLDEEIEFHPVEANLDSIVAELTEIEDDESEMIRVIKSSGCRFLHLEYEEITKDSGTILEAGRKIFDFMGLKQNPVEIRLKKIVNRPAKEIVSNFEEMCQQLQGTRFAKLISD